MNRVLVVESGAAKDLVRAVDAVTAQQLVGEIVRCEELGKLGRRLDGVRAIVADVTGLGERALEVGRVVRDQAALEDVTIFFVGGNDEQLLALKHAVPGACFVGDALLPALEYFLPQVEA